ncbi:hypothetical protein AAD018_001455 [Aestuariibius insulae]|uniref:SctD/MshK family protein n=1 Tax=Aestuariibius insulae TaxID=2058287 RepID=UPI00345E84F9
MSLSFSEVINNLMTALSTYRSFVGIKLAEMRGDLVERISVNCAIGVRIHSGLHEGSETVLNTQRFRIGSEPIYDVMLVDEEVVGPEIRVECEASYLGTIVRVSTYRADAKLNGKPLKSETEVCLPARLFFGGVEVELFDPDTSLKKDHREAALFGSLAVISCVAMGFFIWQTTSWPGDALVREISSEPDPSLIHETVMKQSALTVLDDLVTRAGLSDYVDIVQQRPGSISVTGTLPPSRIDEWNDLRANYDRQGFDDFILSAVSVSRDLIGLPAISLVKLSGEPQLILSSGERLRVGDKIIDEWVIKEITPDGLMLARRGEQMTVGY